LIISLKGWLAKNGSRSVFLSYRSVDKERVRIVAEALLQNGIDTWWDTWESLPGDDQGETDAAINLCTISP
jgi:hypothetical protein